jgi:F420H(2)-dependent quinone reductase
MPLNGEYQPSRNDRTREQVELYEATKGRRGWHAQWQVIVLTFKGAKFGKIRKTPLMRIEHNGTLRCGRIQRGRPYPPFLVLQHRRQPACRATGWRD